MTRENLPVSASAARHTHVPSVPTLVMADGAERAASRKDKSTLSNLACFTYKHLVLDLDVDFQAETLSGTAAWTVVLEDPAVEELVLDTSAGLAVHGAKVNDVSVEHTFKAPHAALGTALVVPFPKALRGKGRELTVTLQYATSPASLALQWLPPAQTAGKQHPYVFSQCQAIHARALFPCPDAPTVKFTYDATIRAPEWSTALMSAVAIGSSTSSKSTKTFTFEQAVPVPSYLVTIAVGELRGITVGPRSTVWSEPSVVEAAAWEFAECEKFIVAAEEILDQPYIWKRYDVLVMPPSFPYGGMENPCLTFATPTLLAGDRSLANVIIHEISHSWTGNLVTNATWEHFWLNEGWTRWLECRIQARLKSAEASPEEGEKLYDFLMQESRTTLGNSIRTFGADHPFTTLVPQLDETDPDDAFSAVPYEKGLALLNLLTATVGGRAQFEKFAIAYIAQFKMRTLTSADFRDFFLSYCEAREIDASGVDWDGWFYTPGLPLVDLTFPDKLGAACVRLVDRWMDEHAASSGGFEASEYAGWPSKMQVHFLDMLCARCEAAPTPPLSRAAIELMDKLYDLTASKNSEARLRWQRVCIRHKADFIVPHVLAFLKEQGRMKFVRPLFRDLYAWEAQRTVAVDTFRAWRSNYHPICQKMLSQDLKLQE